MHHVQSIFVQGPDKGSITERFADTLLSFPRLFIGRTVRVISQKDQIVVGRKIGLDGSREGYLEEKEELKKKGGPAGSLFMECVLSMDSFGVGLLAFGTIGTIGALFLAKAVLISTAILSSAVFAGASVSTALGLGLKAISLETNRRSMAYNLVVGQFLKLENISKNEKAIIKELNKCSKNFSKLEDNIRIQREILACMTIEIRNQESSLKKYFYKIKISKQNRYIGKLENLQKKSILREEFYKKKFEEFTLKESRARDLCQTLVQNYHRVLNPEGQPITVNLAEISSSLFRAIKANDSDLVKQLLKSQKDQLNVQNKNGITPLHEAVKITSKEMIELLLQNGADVNARDKEGKSPLEIAIEKQNLTLIASLLKAKNIQATNDQGVSLIFLVIAQGNEKLLQEFLSHFPHHLEVKNEWGLTPLLFAALLGKAPIVSRLLDNNANLLASTTLEKNTLLHVAASSRNLDTLNLVIERLTKKRVLSLEMKNKDGRTALHLAARTGHLMVIKKLLASGAKQSVVDHFGKRPVDYRPNSYHSQHTSNQIKDLLS